VPCPGPTTVLRLWDSGRAGDGDCGTGQDRKPAVADDAIGTPVVARTVSSISCRAAAVAEGVNWFGAARGRIAPRVEQKNKIREKQASSWKVPTRLLDQLLSVEGVVSPRTTQLPPRAGTAGDIPRVNCQGVEYE
jgi:hypothetical protein